MAELESNPYRGSSFWPPPVALSRPTLGRHDLHPVPWVYQSNIEPEPAALTVAVTLPTSMKWIENPSKTKLLEILDIDRGKLGNTLSQHGQRGACVVESSEGESAMASLLPE